MSARQSTLTDEEFAHDGNHSRSRPPRPRTPKLLAWVRETAELTQPDRVEWVDGSPEEWTRITDLLVENGTFIRLNADKKPNSFWCASDPTDVARVEDRTFICSRDPKDAGATNNWMDPDDMKAILTERFRGSMRGRTMYVLPYCMGPLDADEPMLGAEITDSPYVIASMHIMTRLGTKALELFTGRLATSSPACTRSARRWRPARPTSRGRATTRSTSCTSPRSG